MSHSFRPPRCTTCKEIHLEIGGGASLIPAFPMLLSAVGGTLHAYQSGRELTVKSGSFALFRAAETVLLDAASQETSTLIYTELADCDDSLTLSHRLPLLLDHIDAAKAQDYLDQLLVHHSLPSDADITIPYEGSLLANGLMLLLMQALRQKPTAAVQQSASSDLQKIKTYCLKNLTEKITIADLMEVLPTSATSLNRLIRKAYNMSSMAYVRRLRLERALQLLQSSELRIYEIAMACGFSNSFHFTNVFKKCYNTSPSEYRSRSHDSRLSQGDLLMRQHRYKDAAAAYTKQMNEEGAGAKETLLKLGRAYYHAEDYDMALPSLQDTRGTPYWLKAVPYIIDAMFKFGQFEEGGKLFRDNYPLAEQSVEAEELRTLWIRWFRPLRQHRDRSPVEMLLQLRKDLFPVDADTAMDADRCLLDLDRGNEIAPGRPLYRSALRRAGRYREIVESPYCSRVEKANALISMGEFQVVIDEYSDLEDPYSRALGLLGRAEEGLQLFSEDSHAYAVSLFHNGEYERLLTNHKQHRWLCFETCLMKAEPEQIITEKLANFWITVPVHCLLGQTEEARKLVPPTQAGLLDFVKIIEAAQLLLKGDRAGGLFTLGSIARIKATRPSGRLEVLHAYCFLAHLDKDNQDLAALKEAVRSNSYASQQGFRWFDARLIFDEIDDAAYLAQPRQHPDPHKTLPLFQAIREDLAGNTTEAIKNYTLVYDRYSRNMLPFSTYECWHWYIKWRLQELRA